MRLPPPAIPRESPGSLTILEVKKGISGGEGEQGWRAPENLEGGGGWGAFSISLVAPPPSDFKYGIFPSQPLCQAYDKTGLCIVHAYVRVFSFRVGKTQIFQAALSAAFIPQPERSRQATATDMLAEASAGPRLWQEATTG